MKIFHIVSNKEWGGGEQYVYDLSLRQRADGIDIVIFCKPIEDIIRKYTEAGLQVIPLALGGALDLKSAWQMATIINKEGACTIHAHNFKDAFTACYARKLSSNKNVRVVMCRHLTRTGKNSILYRWLYSQLDRLIFDSQISTDVFLSTNPTIDSNKLGIVHTSIVVPENIVPVNVRKEFNIPETSTVAMFHGRLDPEKGIDTLMDAVEQIMEKDFKLVLIGKGSDEYTEHLKTTVKSKGIAEKIIFAGFRHPVLPYVAGADFGILASTVREGCPLSPQEYMSQGHPVVVTDNGGQREYVEDGRNGLLVTPGNAKQLAEAMGRMIDNPEFRQELGQQAKADFDDHLSYEHYYAKICRIYNE
ncbi:MAG: glycosyltransferase family 4 protein [Prevotella sp.]|nr:glycosyltransferase family 4 protein [Prevotella sp.]MBR4364730.1 glycosyltransferase family 4 protein [Prevotella sp.]